MTIELGNKNPPELIYTVDSSGNLLSLEPRETLHLAKSSKLHAAVIGMLLRKDDKYLLQWRASNKLGGNRLDVSATTHIRRGETYESAVQRSFENELRIKDPVRLEYLFDFIYKEKLGDHNENEFCKVFLGRYDGKFKPNPIEIDRIEFMTLQDLKKFITQDEGKATKWLRETVSRMEN